MNVHQRNSSLGLIELSIM